MNFYLFLRFPSIAVPFCVSSCVIHVQMSKIMLVSLVFCPGTLSLSLSVEIYLSKLSPSMLPLSLSLSPFLSLSLHVCVIPSQSPSFCVSICPFLSLHPSLTSLLCLPASLSVSLHLSASLSPKTSSLPLSLLVCSQPSIQSLHSLSYEVLLFSLLRSSLVLISFSSIPCPLQVCLVIWSPSPLFLLFRTSPIHRSLTHCFRFSSVSHLFCGVLSLSISLSLLSLSLSPSLCFSLALSHLSDI